MNYTEDLGGEIVTADVAKMQKKYQNRWILFVSYRIHECAAPAADRH